MFESQARRLDRSAVDDSRPKHALPDIPVDHAQHVGELRRKRLASELPDTSVHGNIEINDNAAALDIRAQLRTVTGKLG